MQSTSLRKVEPQALSVLALSAVFLLRKPAEHAAVLTAEFVTLAILCGLAMGFHGRRRVASIAGVLCCPIVFAMIARAIGQPSAFELSTLTSFGVTALALAILAKDRRVLALSLVISGFLVLFTAAISDSSLAIVAPVLWMVGCVWHLVASRWEKLDLAMPESVSSTWTNRPAVIVFSGLLLIGTVWGVKDHAWKTHPLKSGFMPVSGGSKWSDPAARSGVGTGDAAIAAKDHAESFGAVDSDVFIESKQSSLFDMFNDMVGEPRKTKYEQRQALANQNLIPSHQKTAKTERGGGSFSTDRIAPKKHQKFDDAKSDDVLQWDGPTGIRLALHRYDTFDGIDWTQTADYHQDELKSVEIGGNHWFFDPKFRSPRRNLNRASEEDSISVGLLKILRLDSVRLPLPMLTQAIHLKDIDRVDFFRIDQDGCMFMPGREQVPPMTVVHVASENLREDDLRNRLFDSYSPQLAMRDNDNECGRLTRGIVDETAEPLDQIHSIVHHLRTKFQFDRQVTPQEVTDESEVPVQQFLRSRRGGDHLFATAAAMMIRELGLPTRLVTGFYVRPNSFDFAAGHASVLPSDVHAWVEVQLNDGRWFEVEPTPGFVEPLYRPSLWLQTKKLAAASWPYALITGLVAGAGYLSRRMWLDWLFVLVWKSAGWMSPKRRCGLAIRVVEARAGLLGLRRPRGNTQRQWIQQLTQTDPACHKTAIEFCDMADAIYFGHRQAGSAGVATRLVRRLDRRTLLKLTHNPS
ncbi:transglutaminase-like domain-containing protein [Roseiconus lacunae]|uniref:transglutaminase-like domain-containing protein n=1 Tax=Roseiconus lacunae TaxID=2605694 RepID=UPI001E2B38E3|nr:transglutaminase-like domain-containing protein [Roseiconus lacunae]MCD0460770.1 transglutaminase-like domain-containing protein [Roseiconus lacunae]